MKNYEIDYLKYLCSMSQIDLAEYLNDWLVSSGTFQDEEVIYLPDGFLYAQGDIPVCLVAHLDTVHRRLPSVIYHDPEQKILWAKEGIGGDDRCGVYAILKILEEGLRPHVIFTFDEEKGGIGASVAADMIKPKLNFMIEIDRRGENDCVFYSCDNDDFQNFVEGFGFKHNWGSFSDISYLAPAWGCAAVNLSAGYEDEHTDVETINYEWLFTNIGRIKKMLLPENAEQAFDYVEKPYSGWGYKYGGGSFYGTTYYNYNTGASGKVSPETYGLEGFQECDACGDWVSPDKFDEYNMLCKKCCASFGLKTQEDREKTLDEVAILDGSMIKCAKCDTWVDLAAYDETTDMCLYCVIDSETQSDKTPTPSSGTFYQQWIDEDNDDYERYSG